MGYLFLGNCRHPLLNEVLFGKTLHKENNDSNDDDNPIVSALSFADNA